MFDGPLPASPENSGEPFWIIAILPSAASLDIPFNTNSCCPSEIFGSPAPNLPFSPSLASFSTAFCSLFQSIPKGGLDMQYLKV